MMKIGEPRLKPISVWEIGDHDPKVLMAACLFTDLSIEKIDDLLHQHNRRGCFAKLFGISPYRAIKQILHKKGEMIPCNERNVVHYRLVGNVLGSKEEWLQRFIDFGIAKKETEAEKIFDSLISGERIYCKALDSKTYTDIFMKKDYEDNYYCYKFASKSNILIMPTS